MVLDSVFLSGERGYDLGPSLQCLPRLRLFNAGDFKLSRVPDNSKWDVGWMHLKLPHAVQLLSSLVSMPAVTPPPQVPPGWAPGSRLGKVSLSVGPPKRGSEEAWRWAVQGLGAVLEAGGCEELTLQLANLGLGLDVPVAEAEATALLTPAVASRLVGLRVFPLTLPPLACHLATLALPALESVSFKVQAEGPLALSAPRLLGALTRLAAPRLRSVSISHSLDESQQQELAVPLMGMCAAQPQPVDAAGEPVPLDVFCELSSPAGDHVERFLGEAGLEGRVRVMRRKMYCFF